VVAEADGVVLVEVWATVMGVATNDRPAAIANNAKQRTIEALFIFGLLAIFQTSRLPYRVRPQATVSARYWV